jgi:hypothetical protein
VQRRQLLRAAAAGAASAGSSTFGWFSAQPPRSSSTRAVGMADVQIIREMTQTFRRLDNRFGGGHARSAVTNYLASDVLPLFREGRYRDDVRRDLFAAVAELNQLAGWIAYDVGDAILDVGISDTRCTFVTTSVTTHWRVRCWRE